MVQTGQPLASTASTAVEHRDSARSRRWGLADRDGGGVDGDDGGGSPRGFADAGVDVVQVDGGRTAPLGDLDNVL